MGQAAFTINLPKEKWGFFSRVPLWFGSRGKKFSPSARALAGRVFGVSQAKNKDNEFWTSYDQIQEELGVCRATVAAATKSLKDTKVIEEKNRTQKGTSYKFIGESGKRYDIVPLYLYTCDIRIGGVDRRLTKSAVLLLAHLMTECKRPKNNGKYEGSIARLAREVNISATTVKKEIKVLLKAGLIYRAAEDKGVNGSKLTRYCVNKTLYDYERFRRTKAKKTTVQDKKIAALDAMSERQRYYSLRQEEMRARAERYIGQALQMAPKLKTIDFDLRALALPAAKAEIAKDDVQLHVILRRRAELRAEREQLLKQFNIEERRMVPEFYARCKKCQDTGYLPNGRGCTCYQT